MKKDTIFNTPGLKHLKKTICEKRVFELRQKATKYELIFKYKLELAGIKFTHQKGFIDGNNFCIADFYLPSPYNLVIEIDGKYHESEKQTKRDFIKNQYYRDHGIRIKRILNEDVETFDLITLIKSKDAKYKPKNKMKEKKKPKKIMGYSAKLFKNTGI